MGGSKHGPNTFRDYESIHETVMARLVDSGFVLSADLAFRNLGLSNDGTATIFLGAPAPDDDDDAPPREGHIECLGGIRLKVEKYIEVLEGEGANALVRTFGYSYNASIGARGNILRYCAPHARPGEADPIEHHHHHHKHRFDPLRVGAPVDVVMISSEDDRPTLGEVIEELRDWYYEHYELIEGHVR